MQAVFGADGGVPTALGRGDCRGDDRPAEEAAEGAPAYKDSAARTPAEGRVLAQPMHARLSDLQSCAAGACVVPLHDMDLSVGEGHGVVSCNSIHSSLD